MTDVAIYDDFGVRLRNAELSIARNTERLNSVEVDVRDFKTAVREDLAEVKSDVKEVRAGQKTLVLALMTAAISFMGAAVPLILVLASHQ